MNLDTQRTNRVLVISLLIFVFIFLLNTPCHGWHVTLKFMQKSIYESNINDESLLPIYNIKFFLWFNSYAIYGARERLLLLRPNLNNSTFEIYSYHMPIDQMTMDECLQEWNTKDKCYNDVVHVRILPDQTTMDVYCTYAHRPMVRSFNLQSMSFINEHNFIRDQHPPIDSESSYVMLTFNTNIITAGYQGDYNPIIRATHGKTLLYALRQNSYFIGGFKYDGKAVFGVIETSETNRISRLVMACANRTEIVRKATLNCSTTMFSQTHPFDFHILTSLSEPIRTSNGSTLLFATFTTNNSSITASAICLFILDTQFYDVFTGPSKNSNRQRTIVNNDFNQLITDCSQTISSTIDRDMVESERQFSSYLSNPLLIETMSTYRFTAINIIQYRIDVSCLIIGTSDGRLLSAFMDRTYKTIAYEELTLPFNKIYSIKSITYRKMDDDSYAIVITNHQEYLIIKLRKCDDKLCFSCWTKDCFIRKILSLEENRCQTNDQTQVVLMNDTDENINNRTISFDWLLTNRVSDDQSNHKLLFYIVASMSFIVFILSISIIILLTKSNDKRKRYRHKYHFKTKDFPAISKLDSNLYINKKKLIEDYENQQDSSIWRTACPVYLTTSSQSLPQLVSHKSETSSTSIPAIYQQPLSARRLYKSYV